MSSHTTRRRFLSVGALCAVAGCLGNQNFRGGASESETERGNPTDGGKAALTEQTASGSGGPLPPTTNRPLPVSYSFQKLRDEVQSGGPPKDGIPSVDDPAFVPASEAPGRLAPDDVVFGVVRDGEAKAYPQYILVWHEVVNDKIGGDPVSVTYCPLTGTAMGFERGEATFGVSGRLLNSNLVMYDRGSDSRWPQMLATAIAGPLEGESLQEFRVVWTTWRQWRTAHPETTVLSEDTGYVRDYGRDPYGSYNPRRGYYTNDSTLFAPLSENDHFSPKTVVFGTRSTDEPIAFEKTTVRDEGLVQGESRNEQFLVVSDPQLDTAYLYRNPDGTEFTREGGQIVDSEGTSYPPADLPLEDVYLFEAMWFAWAGFYPDTDHD